MNEHHAELLGELNKNAEGSGAQPWPKLPSYLGTSKICYGVPAAVKGRIVRDLLKKHPDLTVPEYVELVSSLCRGRSFDEVSLAGALLGAAPKLRRQLDPRLLDRWLEYVEGWAETDSLCQSSFTAQEVLARWEEWQELLVEFATSSNIHKRRASLVLLARPIRESADERLAELALANIERLKVEKGILITKAVSWLLRDLVKHHKTKVADYLEANADSLPRIAVRETRRKLLTGKK